MKLRRTGFYIFATLVFLCCILYAMSAVFARMGPGQEYPYLLRGLWLLGALAFCCAFLLFAAVLSRMETGFVHLRAGTRLSVALEGVLAVLILAAAFLVRLVYIRRMPMIPASDYKTYYEIAQLLHQGRLLEDGPGYCDYISKFPHVFGYPRILAWVFAFTGESVLAAQIVNLVAQTLGCVAVWRIARLVGGRLAGMTALLLAAAVPSTVFYSNFVASEPVFTAILLCGIWLFTRSVSDTEGHARRPWSVVFELVGAGLLLAFASFVRPMALIFVVAAVLCLAPGESPLPALPLNDIPLALRAADKGWKRCALLLASYFLASSLFTLGTSYAVDRELAGGSASFGYNLLVGLNLESQGGWNAEDADFFDDSFELTGSAQEAQAACRDMALRRLNVDVRALLNLFVHKFELLWGNDDYGASTNILFMDQQGTLTRARESFLYDMMDVSNLYYLFLLFGALVAGCIQLRRRPDAGYACVLLFCGTVVLHLLVESQNRYHYHALPLLCILCGVAAGRVLSLVRQRMTERLIEKARIEAEREERERIVERITAEERERERLRAEALHAQFDMGKAIREGHVRVIMSEASAQAAERKSPTAAERKEEANSAV